MANPSASRVPRICFSVSLVPVSFSTCENEKLTTVFDTGGAPATLRLDGSPPLYHLPVDLTSHKDKLTDVEIIIGPARGAEMLMSGIRSIRAVHPSKKDREFLAQVLATGSASQ